MPPISRSYKDALKRSFQYRSSFDADRDREAKKAASALLSYRRAGLQQVAVVMDATGSMAPHIAGARKCIVDVARKAEADCATTCRFAVVAYRDHSDGIERIERMTEFGSARDVEVFLSSVVAKGGDDGPEDVFGGLMAASELPWESPQRLIIWIGDAPQHGRQYHTSDGDNYPDGCPLGLTGQSVGKALAAKNIPCLFLEVTEHTAKMISLLTEEFRSVGAVLKSQPMGDVAETLLRSLSASASATVSVGAELSCVPRNYTVDPAAAVPSVADKFSVKVYTLRPTMDLPGGLHPLEVLMTRFPETHEQATRLQIAEKPFAEGEFRYAFRASLTALTYHASWHGVTEKVVKCSRYVGSTLGRDQARIQCCSDFLAREFSERVAQRDDEGIYKPVVYVPAQLMKYQSEEWLVEPFIQGNFQKFNNNNGAVMDAEVYLEPQAFSHFTHHYSGGRLMVTDVQGVANADHYVLTDAAIHTASSADVLPDSTNLGVKGMVAFYVTHKCNDVCRLMGLPDVPQDATALEQFVEQLARDPRDIMAYLADHTNVEVTTGGHA